MIFNEDKLEQVIIELFKYMKIELSSFKRLKARNRSEVKICRLGRQRRYKNRIASICNFNLS